MCEGWRGAKDPAAAKPNVQPTSFFISNFVVSVSLAPSLMQPFALDDALRKECALHSDDHPRVLCGFDFVDLPAAGGLGVKYFLKPKYQDADVVNSGNFNTPNLR